MVEGSNPSGPIKDRAAFLVQFWVLLSIIAIIPYIPAILLSMVELFLTVAGLEEAAVARRSPAPAYSGCTGLRRARATQLLRPQLPCGVTPRVRRTP